MHAGSARPTVFFLGRPAECPRLGRQPWGLGKSARPHATRMLSFCRPAINLHPEHSNGPAVPCLRRQHLGQSLCQGQRLLLSHKGHTEVAAEIKALGALCHNDQVVVLTCSSSSLPPSHSAWHSACHSDLATHRLLFICRLETAAPKKDKRLKCHLP